MPVHVIRVMCGLSLMRSTTVRGLEVVEIRRQTSVRKLDTPDPVGVVVDVGEGTVSIRRRVDRNVNVRTCLFLFLEETCTAEGALVA